MEQAKLVLALVLLPLFITSSSQGSEDSHKEVPASEILAKISRSEPVVYDHVIIKGDLRLDGLGLPIIHIKKTDYEIIIPNKIIFIKDTKDDIIRTIFSPRELMLKMLVVENEYLGSPEDIRLVRSPIEIVNSVIDGRIYFNDTLFNGSLSIAHSQFKSEAFFENSQFNSSADFGGSEFNSTGSFVGSQFNSYANFADSQFNSYASFWDSQFKSTADFRLSQFNSFASFDRSQFMDTANFFDSQFKGSAYFIESQFNSDTNFESSQFNDEVNFWCSHFNGNATFNRSHFNSSAIFIASHFDGVADFSGIQFKGADFHGSQFNGDAKFPWSLFNSYADFSGSQFKGTANFFDSQFKGFADFGESQFNSDANFCFSRFYGVADFIGSQFNETAWFSFSNFWERNFFMDSQFNSYANFASSSFYNFSSFDRSQFKGIANFGGSDFKSTADFSGSQFKGTANFGGSDFKSTADFSGSQFKEGLILTNTSLNNIEIDWFSIGNYALFVCDRSGYISLIKHFKDIEDFEAADDCYYRYRNWRLLSENQSWSKRLIDFILLISCGYGVKPWHTIFLSFILILLFGLIYWWKRILQKNGSQNVSYGDAVFYSASIFFTLDPKAIWDYNEHWRYLIIFEDILGWILMTLFVVTMGHVMLR